MIISVAAAKIWYLKNVWFLLGHPVYFVYANKPSLKWPTSSSHINDMSNTFQNFWRQIIGNIAKARY